VQMTPDAGLKSDLFPTDSRSNADLLALGRSIDTARL
jgi:hypothetical protein